MLDALLASQVLFITTSPHAHTEDFKYLWRAIAYNFVVDPVKYALGIFQPASHLKLQ